MSEKVDYSPMVSCYRLVFFEYTGLTPVVLMECVHRDGVDLYKKWHKKCFGCTDSNYRIDKREKYSKQWVIGI